MIFDLFQDCVCMPDVEKKAMGELLSKAISIVEKKCVEKRNLQKRIKELEALRDTVSINCNPPDDCNDPVVLKTYMKACFDEAEKLYD